MTHQTLEGLHKSCFDFEFGDPSKQKMAQAKIKQIISDHYVEFSLLAPPNNNGNQDALILL
jgi:hypothetical protein